MYDMGRTREKPEVSIIDYSKKNTNDFGVTTVVERGYSKRIVADVIIPEGGQNQVALDMVINRVQAHLDRKC